MTQEKSLAPRPVGGPLGDGPRMVPTVLAPEVHYPSYGNALYVFALSEK